MAARFGQVLTATHAGARVFRAECERCPEYRGTAQATREWAAADLAHHRRVKHPDRAGAADRQARYRAARVS